MILNILGVLIFIAGVFITAIGSIAIECENLEKNNSKTRSNFIVVSITLGIAIAFVVGIPLIIG